MRPRISRAALLVKVTARMPCGEAPCVDDPGDAMREHARLAAARAGQHQHRAHGRGDGFALRVVQRVENGGEIHGGADFRGHSSFPLSHLFDASSRAWRRLKCDNGNEECPRYSLAFASSFGLFGAITFSSKYCRMAVTSARNTGPTTIPMVPNAAMPPTTPTNTVNAETGA